MGVQYLWIDALCIVQDSQNDWAIQSCIMDEIYAGSYCNIAALSEPGDNGFLRQRQPEWLEPQEVKIPSHAFSCPNGVIAFTDFWCNSLLNAPLHSRAWVLQERQMSSRTIHFEEQIFWDCREHKACEVYPAGIPNEFSNERTKLWRHGGNDYGHNNAVPINCFHPTGPETRWANTQPHTSRDVEAYKTWTTLVVRYMDCQLTFASDKLPALQGLANKIGRTCGRPYLAGLWDNPDLAHSLLWYTPTQQQGTGEPSIKHCAGDGPQNAASSTPPSSPSSPTIRVVLSQIPRLRRRCPRPATSAT